MISDFQANLDDDLTTWWFGYRIDGKGKRVWFKPDLSPGELFLINYEYAGEELTKLLEEKCRADFISR
jgi:hypothetical protein